MVDSGPGTVTRYRVDDATGTVHSGQVILRVDRRQAIPDGLAMDGDGGLWLALWGGFGLIHLLPDGSVRGRVRLPARNVTSCAYIEVNVLAVTSAADDVNPEMAGGNTWLVRVDRDGALATGAPDGRRTA
jgi:sugar lactone lactonase YvrE